MDHLAISVADQGHSRRFYETYFGFGARPPRRYDDGVLILYDAAVLSFRDRLRLTASSSSRSGTSPNT